MSACITFVQIITKPKVKLRITAWWNDDMSTCITFVQIITKPKVKLRITAWRNDDMSTCITFVQIITKPGVKLRITAWWNDDMSTCITFVQIITKPGVKLRITAWWNDDMSTCITFVQILPTELKYIEHMHMTILKIPNTIFSYEQLQFLSIAYPLMFEALYNNIINKRHFQDLRTSTMASMGPLRLNLWLHSLEGAAGELQEGLGRRRDGCVSPELRFWRLLR